MDFIKKNSKLIIFCIILVIILVLNKIFGWSAYLSDSENLSFLSKMIEENMLAASLIYIGITIVACTVLALPGVIFAILAGVLFGPWWGTLFCLVATTIGAIISFIVGRFFLQDSIKPVVERSKLLKKLLFDDVGRSDILLLAITRLVPLFPYNIQNFAYGITDMSLSHYSLYTFLFMIPGVALYTIGAAGFTSDGNKVLYFGIAAVLLAVTLLLAWFIKKKYLDEEDNKNLTKISIVLAVYNGERDVKRCINSLRKQTYRNIEIVCIDDCSTDKTLKILKRMAKRDSRIKVFEQGSNKKLLLAVKRGIKESTGDYIMFIDDDDWYEPNACEKVAEIIETEHPDVVCFGTKLVELDGEPDEALKTKRANALKSRDFKFEGKNALGLKELKYNYIWNRAIRSEIARKAYDSLPDIELNYYSDSLACVAIFYYAKSVVSIKKKLTNYNYKNGLSAEPVLSAEAFDYMMKSMRIYEDEVTKFLEEKDELEELKNFKDKYDNRIKSYVRAWKERVPADESELAFKSLLKYFNEDSVNRALDTI